MKKTFIIILISVFAFIAVNTLFYINIYKKQLSLQTDLLSRQIRICGNNIEQNGLSFENEVNYILYSEDITRLFRETGTKEPGCKNLELFYTKYQYMINKINIYDNQKHVYSLVLDKKNNFVSDFYESQQQIPLLDRDQLYTENGKTFFAIPVFKDNVAQSNIIIEIDFINYVSTLFDRYKIENTLWQWMITDEGEIVSTFGNDLLFDSGDLQKISEEIMEGNESFLIHNININGEPVKTVSVFYPLRLIRSDFGIVFSIKTDLFLRSIYLKIIIITIASVILIILILFINFRIIKVKSAEAHKYEISEQALRKSIDHLPIGLIIVNPDQTIRIINKAATELLLLDKEQEYTGENITKVYRDEPDKKAGHIYCKAFGEGTTFTAGNKFHQLILFKQEFLTDINKHKIRILLIIDITAFEENKKLDTLAHIAKSGLMENMSYEIRTPLDEIRRTLNSLSAGKVSTEQKGHLQAIQKSVDLLENLIKAVVDFVMIESGEIVFKKIPYRLRNEINLAAEQVKPLAAAKNISIITKIRNDVPEKIIGDPFRLRQVVSQLLDISLNHTHEGRILLSAELTGHTHDICRILFQIDDTGEAIRADLLDKYLNRADDYTAQDVYDPGEMGLKLLIVKQQVEIMRGHFKAESPSSISTHPDFPGMRYTFSIECIPDEIPGKEFHFDSVHNLNDIQILVLSQTNEPESPGLVFLEKTGMNIKQRIYRNDHLDSIVQYIKENITSYHILIIIDQPGYDGFILAQKLFEEELSCKFLLLIISSSPLPDNLKRSKAYQIDYYLTEPIENKIFSEIIRDHFKGLPDESFKHLPGWEKINEHLAILVAEYNPFTRKVTQGMFKSLGFEVDLAKNGNEVITLVNEKKYDIVFMDLFMPGKDALKTAADIREKGYTMPIIAFTDINTSETKQMIQQQGIDEYLVKPVTTEIFRKVLLKFFSESA